MKRKKPPEPKLIQPLGPLLIILAPLVLHAACESYRERPMVLE